MSALDRDADLESTIGAIYDAALDPARWDDALTATSRLFDSQAVTLHVCDHGNGAARVVKAVNFGAKTLAEYAAYYRTIDPWTRIGDTLAAGSVVYSDAMFPVTELRKTEFHADLLSPAGLAGCVAAIIARDGSRFASYTVVYDQACNRQWSMLEKVALLRRLAPHLMRAVRIQRQLGRAESVAGTLAEMLGRLPNAALAVGRDGLIHFANAAAETLLRAPNGLRAVHGRLTAGRPSDQASLLTLLAAQSSAGGALAIARPDGKPPLHVLVAPIPRSSAAAEPILGVSGPEALVFIHDPERPTRISPTVLTRLYGLTRAEAALAAALAEGESLDGYAAGRGVSIHTVRSQVKSVFAKTGAIGQADLTRLILAGPAVFAGEPVAPSRR